MSNSSPQPQSVAQPVAKYRKDYAPPTHLVDTVTLDFDIQAEYTDVSVEMQVRPNPEGQAGVAEWRLDGRDMALLNIAIDGKELAQADYSEDAEGITLKTPSQAFTLNVKNRIKPDANTALEGFYRSGDILTTQCESNGFSRITYFPDRPDVLSRYRVSLTADKQQYPILLSNGDCVEQGHAGDGRHYAVWEDPYPKPCYLFAAVAGDLAEIKDSHTTTSGREVAIRFYTDHGNENLCGHAILALKQAMVWDERVYGLEYDLDTYMVVAVGSFNMGAMENKGLNIFNTSCIFASPETATDHDFATVRDVVAHEYFHNYTGNRVTCQDWFQLSLKEGLTVFREQQFAADHNETGVTRIEQARIVRNVQFPEDAGPTAHPVRPESYIEMNNFYTITIYQKGSEVIRMMHTMLGDAAFNKAIRHYLKKHDGQAASIEDFVVALEESSGADLQQFRLWYSQAGTPKIQVDENYEADTGKYHLTLSQSMPPTPGQQDKQPMHIPLALKLFDAQAKQGGALDSKLLHLRETEQSWTFDGLNAKPTLSLLQGFTAPVKLSATLSAESLAQLMQVEDDAFARWEAAQQLLLQVLMADVKAHSEGTEACKKEGIYEAFSQLLAHPPEDPALLAEMLTLPTEGYLAEQFEQINVDAIIKAHADLKTGLGLALAEPLEALLQRNEVAQTYRFEPAQVAQRSLAGVCLQYLAAADVEGIRERCLTRYENADNMTDSMAALNALRDLDCPERETALAHYEQRWQDQPLALDKWFALHAASRVPKAFEQVQALLGHPRFDLTNPNRVRALLGTFARANICEFHRADGAGYEFVGDQVLALNALNPQVAARLVGAFSQWRRYPGRHGELMQAQLERILSSDKLSRDVYEIVEKSLQA